MCAKFIGLGESARMAKVGAGHRCSCDLTAAEKR